MEQKIRTLFFKASRPIGEVPKLDPIRVARNHLQDIATTLVLDTNILIKMERVVRSGNKVSAIKPAGLHNLLTLLERCPSQSIYLSPAFAFGEMPPALAENCRQAFDVFLARHLPNFVDSPDAIPATYSGKSKDYGFFDLEMNAQMVLAVPFCSLVYLQVVDRMSRLKPIEKFERYLDMAEEELDVLSAKEVEIARYCFANPRNDSRELIDLRRVFRRNFVQTKEEALPRSPEQLLAVAFNGASDLNLLNSANVLDNQALDGIIQDCWITTTDKKLERFSQISHSINFDNEAGKIAASEILAAHADDPYWEASSRIFHLRCARRAPKYWSHSPDVQRYPEIAKRAARLAHESFSTSD
ncbi:hypothetical protein [Achromobacter sp. 2789STDY5608621]|uniref:hypothetical protein n=1 Tax=Achromobacter sp. 2789STDY5608621 TaxID=1806496 RepID=UPI0006C5F6FF|nr:hypothetical protein [Achromobacter sp. 2789STDY5608621]CUJ41211.1 Uncharacterised protein [Achromobacter sp. 2789STDY5608621]